MELLLKIHVDMVVPVEVIKVIMVVMQIDGLNTLLMVLLKQVVVTIMLNLEMVDHLVKVVTILQIHVGEEVITAEAKEVVAATTEVVVHLVHTLVPVEVLDLLIQKI